MKTKLTTEQWLRYILYFLIFLLWAKEGISTDGDAITYINMLPQRSAGYPIFIKITTLFGVLHSFRLTGLVALVMGLLFVHRFVDYLKKQFDLSCFSVVVTSVVLLLPYLVNKMANGILTESVAYPLFILSIHLLIKALFEKDKRSMIWYFVVVCLLILVRSQFIFLHIISLLAIIYLVWHTTKKGKLALPLIGIFVLTIIADNLIERTYHLAAHKQFTVAPSIGVQLETMPLYNAKPTDDKLFTDSLEKGVVDTVLLCEKNYDIYNIAKNKTRSAEFETFKFMHCYNPISWQFAEKYIENSARKQGMTRTGMDFWKYLDKVSTHIAITLIKAHPKDYFWMYFADFKSAFGDWPLFIPYLMLFLFSIVSFFKRGNKLSIFLTLACLLMLGNAMLTCFFEPPLDRYMFYTTNLLVALVLIPVFKMMENALKTKEQA